MSDEIGQQAMGSFRYTVWWWIVAEKGTVELRDGTFDASARFDPCGLANDGYCNVPGACPAGDYNDCGTAPSAAAQGYFFDPCLTANDGKCDSADPWCATTDYIDCRKTPPPDAGPFGKLLNVRSAQAEVVVRSSTVTNLTIHVAGSLGVVNSTFVPQLNASDPTTRTVQPHPDCGTKLLGRPLCDPRALCLPNASGVECSCVGEGLDFFPGVRADGQQCQQQTSIRLLTQTSRVTMSVQKPSFRADAVAVVFAAAGETGFTASYNVTMKRVRPTDCASRLQGGHSTAREWSSIDQQRMSMDGHHVVWKGPPPSAASAVDLSFDAQKFSFSRKFELAIELNCTAGEPCVEDGDTVHTRVTAASAADGLVSEVVISTAVESLVSCDRSLGRIEGLSPDEDSVSASSTLKLHIAAHDCDGLPIKYTRADIEFTFNGERLAVTWNCGSHEYTADVPSALTEQPGRYELVVSAVNGWDSTSSRVTKCVLLRRTIEIAPAINVKMIIAGAVAGALLLSLLLLMVYLVRSHYKEEARRIVISFMKHEGVLAVKLAWEFWVRRC
jgi:hypothetical protein